MFHCQPIGIAFARFWPAFAERVSRLVASQSLDGPTMARARTWAAVCEDIGMQYYCSTVMWDYVGYETLNRMFTAEHWIQKFAEVFAACSQWKQKCHEDVNWGHMIRDLVDLLKLWNIGTSRVVLPMYFMAHPVVNPLSIHLWSKFTFAFLHFFCLRIVSFYCFGLPFFLNPHTFFF